MNLIYKSVLMAFVALSLTACRSDDAVDDADILIDLSTQFSSSLFQTYESSGKRSTWMHLETLLEYSCENYALNVSFEKYGFDMYLDINGIYRPDNVPCITGPNTASALIEMGSLGTGSYTIHIKLLNEVEMFGMLINKESHIDLEFPEDGWIESEHQRMIKVPENTIWGYYLDGSGHFNQNAADFINGLEGFGAPLENDGNFGNYLVQTGQVRIVEYEQTGKRVFNGFGMKYSDDHQVLRDWISENYCEDIGEIGLYSTQGDLLPCQ